MELPSKAEPTDPVLGIVVAIVQAVPQQSASDDVPFPLNVEWICSRIDSASMVCVLSILLRLFVAIAATISVSILSDRTRRMMHATSVSTMVTPAWEHLGVFPGSVRSEVSNSPILGGLYDG